MVTAETSEGLEGEAHRWTACLVLWLECEMSPQVMHFNTWSPHGGPVQEAVEALAGRGSRPLGSYNPAPFSVDSIS